MKITNIFFDLDHTLWDFEKNSKECLLEIYIEFDLHQRMDFENFFTEFSKLNQKLWTDLEYGIITANFLRENRFKMVCEFLGYAISISKSLEMNAMFLRLLPIKNHLIPFATELLTVLSKDYALHIITNGYLTIQTQKLQNCGIHEFFDKIITHDLANAHKPNKAIFDYALTLTNSEAQNALMIGDNLKTDIFGAKNAGFNTLHFDSTGVSTETFFVKTLQEIPEQLKKMQH